MTRPQMIQAQRLLRYAKVGEPTTLTPKRRAVLNTLLQRGLVERVGERRSGVLLKITKAGLAELAVLEAAEPGHADYGAKQAVRRARQ